MSSPTGYVLTRPTFLTGNAQADSLIFGAQWLSPDFGGSDFFSTRLTYSFVTPGQSYFAKGYSPVNEFLNSYALTSAQQTAVTSALNAWSAVANIKFTLISDINDSAGDLRFGGYAGMDPKTAAWAYFPDEKPLAGDVWIGPATDNPNPVRGTYDYMTFVHEIGHALGLKHPFEASPTNNTLISPLIDDSHFTLMSYNNTYSYQPTTPMVLDILVIQQLYGANMLWQTGDNVYKWASDQSVFETLWDAGGNDTIDASNQMSAVTLNLNEGQYSQIGKAFVNTVTQISVNDGLAIAFGAKIENAIGSAFNDTLVGNSLDNVLDGRAGADTMSGGAGNDTYIVDNVGDTIVEAGSSLTEIDTVISAIDYILGTNLENLTLWGSDNLNGTGNSLNNVLTGNTGNNTLDGGAGADTLIGGTGNDTYIVDNANDVVVESSTLANEIDTVLASLSYTLSSNVENLTLTGTGNFNGSGNSLNNVLTGNSGNNILIGGDGLDTMIGGAGNDTYLVDQVGELALIQELANEGLDTLYVNYAPTAQTGVVDLNITSLRNIENVTLGAAGAFTVLGNDLNNTLLGNALANNLQGGAGNDLLNGGAGADTLIGGTGDDTYIVDNTNDVIVENANEGYDRVQSSANYVLSANVEAGQLTGNDSLYLVGNDLNNELTGNSADNILDGKAGADTMSGGAGNDTYVVDNVGDVVIELGTSLNEIDSIVSSVSYTLSNNVENLTLRGSDNLNGTGNSLNNVLTGNTGNNILDGGAGADTLIGGTGNDTYIVDNANDVVVESSTLANEIDTVLASLSYTLSSNVENLTLTGTGNFNGSGNSLNNVLTGNSGNNILIGGDGLDTMIGGAGNDTYLVDQVGELALIQELANEGLDTLYVNYAPTAQTGVVDLNITSLRNIENVTLGAAGAFTVLGNDLNNTLLGNALANNLQGGAGNDLLNGGAGADTLFGGTGDDTYIVDNTNDVIVENANEGYDRVQSSANYVLSANVEAGQLTGNDSLYLVGNDLNNELTGNSADNILDGKAGADTMSGGAGNDTYVVDNVGDVVIELGTSLNEIDSIVSSVSYTLSNNVENLTLRGSDNLNGTGNSLNNVLTGNTGNNTLDGGAGADTLIGGTGNDTYIVDNANDVVVESSTLANEIDTVLASLSYTLSSNVENLTLTGTGNFNGSGNSLNNVLTGNSGNNILIGGDGLDTMIGGAGNDTYLVDQVGELALIQELANEGLDTLYVNYAPTAQTGVVDLNSTSLRNIENVTLGAAGAFTVLGNDLNNTLLGNALANNLQGGAGNDLLNGGAGADTLIGGTGDDTYIVDNTNDVIVENANEGYDRVQSSANYVLSANVEAGQLTGNDSLYLVGNDLNNELTGNSADNILDGKAGADTMSGGAGNDTYVVDNVGDVVIELGTSLNEIDSIVSSVSYTLSNNVENLTLRGSDNLNGTGNSLNNVLTGNTGNNILDGGAGADTLTGNAGADTFVFAAANEMGIGLNRDVITDFNSQQGDKIDLTKFDANMLDSGFNGFSFIGAADFTGAGQLRFVDHVLSGNVSGNAGADFEIHLVGVNSFSANDLVA